LFAEGKAHGTNKTIDGFYTKTTQKGGYSKLCEKKEKKRCYTTYSIFEHVYGKHNLVSFYGRIVF
jgi:hypothetical protein